MSKRYGLDSTCHGGVVRRNGTALHIMFMERNNLQIADQAMQRLNEKKKLAAYYYIILLLQRDQEKSSMTQLMGFRAMNFGCEM